MKKNYFLLFCLTLSNLISAQCTPTAIASPSSICSGQTATLTASGGTTYTWSANAGGSNLSSVVVSPGSTTVYTVTATTGTCVASATVAVNVTPTPTLMVIASPATICSGQSSTLTASSATTYTWSANAGGATSNTTVVTPTAGTTYTVSGSNGGCVSTQTVHVNVSSNPTVTVNSATICAGSTTTLSATGAISYSWSPGTGLSSTAASSVQANPTSTIVYTVTGSTGTCSGSATSTVVVNPLPVITAANNGPVCAGDTVNFLANSNSGGMTWSWSGPAGFSSASSNPSIISAAPASNGNYTVVGTDANGCSASAITSVTINPLPSIPPVYDQICVGQQTATLTAQGAITYTWNPGTGLSSTSGATVTGNPTSTTVYTITGTDANACTSSVTATIMVNSLPPVTVNSAMICLGQQTATLTVSGATVYTWTPATGLSNTNGTTVLANPNSTTVYTITGTDANGCVNMATSTVTVNPLPVVLASSATICLGSSATLTASGANTYTWDTGVTGPSLNDNPSSTTMYTVTGTDANGCMSTATATIGVNALPSATFTLQADTAPHVWDAYPTYSGVAPFVYNWSWGDGANSSGGYPSHTYSVAGTYSVCVTITDAVGCVNTYCQNDSVYRYAYNANASTMIQLNVINPATGIKNGAAATMQIHLYPNPACALLNLEVANSITTAEIKILDMLGKQIRSEKLEFSQGKATLDVSDLNEGVYFVRVRTSEGAVTQKIIVRR